MGEIALDLVVNQNQYNRQLKGITSLAKKAGAVLAAAFTTKAIINFGKECIELGSDLAEVQNVVDVTFPAMTAQVDSFAKSTAETFGLSETMAKKFTGTFGAMAKAFGFTEEQAYDMSTALTGLAGDVASFYNLSQDEAYTKLKSVFTGETESLKDLGVVMTQTALDSYALANGFGKTTQAMSEAEKVALRYSFVQEQLSAASGDFARTSDSWANQVRILSLQFDSLKATIGQGLINVFTPVIKVINTVIGKLGTLANAFKSFTELITGKKATDGQMADTGSAAEKSLNSAAGAAENLEEATTGAGNAAKKATKEMRALMGFDQIQKTNAPSSDSGNTGGAPSGGTASGAVDFGSLAEGENIIEKTDTALSSLINSAKELGTLFSKGFTIGFGDSQKNIGEIKKSIASIKTSLTDIFTSKEVLSAAGTWVKSVTLNLGKITGSVAKTGISIATNLTSGIANALEEKKDYIKTKLSNLFLLDAKMWNITGDFAVALGDIISGALTNKSAINITSDICSILITGVMGGAELFAQAGIDLVSFITQPIVDNKDKLSRAIEDTLSPVSTVIGTAKKAVEDAFSEIKKAYDKHVAPMFKTIREGTSDTFGKFLDAYHKYVAPALQSIADKFEEIYEPHIKPVLKKLGELIGEIADAVKDLYLKWVKPFADWIAEELIPVLAPVFETLGTGIAEVFGAIGDIVGGFIDALKGVVEFLTGIFTGNWEKVWSGIKDIVTGWQDACEGVVNGVKSIFSSAIEAIKKIFSPLVDWFKTRVKETLLAYAAIPSRLKSIFKLAYEKITGVFSGIGAWFQKKCTSIKNVFANIPTWFKEKFKGAYTNVKNAFSSISTYFKEKYSAIKNVFASIPTWFKTKFSDAWTKIKAVFSGVGNFFGGIWDTIKSKFSAIGTKIGDAIGGSFKSVINSILATVEGTVNRGIGFINSAIGVINKIPGVDIGKMDTLSLPRLAQGGYVKKNTPQLAMIGDNLHQGEVVAPEDKLLEMATKAAQMTGGNQDMGEAISLLKQLISMVSDGTDIVLMVDGQELARASAKGSLKLKRRYSTTKVVFE